MNVQQAEARFQLTLLKYPNNDAITSATSLIYETTDKNLVASLSSLPYVVGRSFSKEESQRLHSELKRLNIYHRFKSDIPGTELSHEEPNTSTDTKDGLPQITPSKKIGGQIIEFPHPQAPQHRFEWRIWIAIALMAIAAITTVMISLQNPQPKSETAVAGQMGFDAKVTQISKKVELRPSQELTWKPAQKGDLLHHDDSIKTFNEAFASIWYQSGTSVQVRPNTLIVIGKSPVANSETINLEDGAIHAHIKKLDQNISIQTAAGVIEIKGKDSTNGNEARIETSSSNNELKVSVISGSATLTSTNKNIPPVAIESLEQVTASPTEISKPTVFKPEIKLRLPLDNETIQVNPSKNSPVRFMWDSLGEEGSYKITISSRPDLSDPLIQERTRGSDIEFNYLDIGDLYWRITSEIDGIHFESPIWRIHVQKSNE